MSGLLIAVSLFFSACQSKTQRHQKIRVATAANMQFAMDELAKAFTSTTGKECEIILSSSGKLTAQITAGAPYDLFVSADLSYPEALHAQGLTTQAPEVYAYGHLVVWTTKDLDLEKLIELSPEHVALANPETAPYGRAALEALKNMGLDSLWQNRFVYGESIAQVNQFVNTGAATLGFTAKSVVLAPNLSQKGLWTAVEEQLYTPIAQGVVILQKEKPNPESQKFYDFLFSDEAKAILHKFGYTAAEK